MTLSDFIKQWDGKYNDFDGRFGSQCKDLFSSYNRDVVGNPNYVSGDAWKLWDNAPPEYYDKIINTPTSVPQAGDVIIWKQSFGGYGHVAIFVDGDVNKMRVFGQNYPKVTKLDAKNNVIANGSPCNISTMSYDKVQGYLRPKKAIVAPPPPPAENKDEVIGQLKREVAQYLSYYNESQKQLSEVSIQLQEKNAVVDELNRQLDTLRREANEQDTAMGMIQALSKDNEEKFNKINLEYIALLDNCEIEREKENQIIDLKNQEIERLKKELEKSKKYTTKNETNKSLNGFVEALNKLFRR